MEHQFSKTKAFYHYRKGLIFLSSIKPSSNFTGNETAANLNSANAKAVTIKAKWTSNLPSFYTITYMQEMTSTVCNSVQTPTTSATASVTKNNYATYGTSTSYVPETTLKDSRDNNTYTVRKLADGKCWMVKKDLYILAGTKITPANSNIASDYTIPQSTSSFESTSGQYATNYNSRGYYSYPAATAGTNPYSGEATYDICAKGWKLPSETQYSNLASTYGVTATNGSKLISFPAEFLENGGYYGPSGLNAGTVSYYWTSTANGMNTRSQYVAGNFRISNTYYYLTPYCSKNDGDTIRCVAK